MSKRLYSERLGKLFTTNEGYEIKIVEYYSANNCTFEFLYNGYRTYNKRISEAESGTISNPFHKSVKGVGYKGVGKYKSFSNGKISKVYAAWRSMIARCYCEFYLMSQPTYKGLSVCEEWHNFQNFGEWYEKNFNPEIMQGWQLDKDIICTDCKLYSPETCAFVPQEVNKVFTKRQNDRGLYPIGVKKEASKFVASYNKFKQKIVIGKYSTPEEAFEAYKTAKEAHIREVAEKWRDKINPRVYEAMLKYEVQITD